MESQVKDLRFFRNRKATSSRSQHRNGKTVIGNHLLPLLHKHQCTTPYSWPPAPKLTFWGWLGPGRTMRLQELCITIVSDLEHKASVHHTVPGLEAPVGETPMVQIPQTLGRDIWDQ